MSTALCRVSLDGRNQKPEHTLFDPDIYRGVFFQF